MNLAGKNIGVVMCGSFCTFDPVLEQIDLIKKTGANIIPVMSESAHTIDTRFGMAKDFAARLEEISGRKIISTIADAEKIGPGNLTDIMLIAPCTGNTLAKLSHGITDTSALMAVKSHMRNNKPVCIFLSTNDSLGFNLENIGKLLNAKNIYFVPFNQDNCQAKPKSMISKADLTIETLENALEQRQLQPIIYRQ